jgi:predicted dehydrogenase
LGHLFPHLKGEWIMTSPTTRRDFLKTAAAAGAGYWVAGNDPTDAAQQQAQAQANQGRPVPANEKVNIAVIGAGGQGHANMVNLNNMGQANVVALADVDDARGAQGFNLHPKAVKFKDYRVMLEQQRNIDAVLIATPDHMHAHAAAMAIRLGKHVYVEKPLTHDIAEARLLKKLAQEHRVQTQMGNNWTATDEIRRGIEILRSGAIGDVTEIHVWTNRPIWPQNIARPTNPSDAPATIDWDKWIGTAPMRPYAGEQPAGPLYRFSRMAYAPFNWRGWWDFGTGAIGDMACHTMNLPLHGLKLSYPTSVVAELDNPLNPESCPMGCRVSYEFPARGNLPACKMYWYEIRRPPASVLQGENIRASGSIMVGTRGSLLSNDDYGRNLVLLPRAQFQGFQDPPRTFPRLAQGFQGGHHREWIDAIRGGPAATSNFIDAAALLTEVALLGNLAMRVTPNKIEWDSERMVAKGLPAADQYIKRQYRKGWELTF